MSRGGMDALRCCAAALFCWDEMRCWVDLVSGRLVV